jgi:hypothetical protein
MYYLSEFQLRYSDVSHELPLQSCSSGDLSLNNGWCFDVNFTGVCSAAPASMMGISRRVYPIVSLNPYQGNWTIKVRVTSKGPLRSFKNARGAGNVFNVELTDEDVCPYVILSHVFCCYAQSLLFSCN